MSKMGFYVIILLIKGYDFKHLIIDPLKRFSLKIWGSFTSYISPLCILSNIHVKLAIHFSLEDKIVKNYLYMSKLEAQMVTSTSSENLSLQLYEAQNKNFNFGNTNPLILHTRSIFFKGGNLTKIWSKKIFFMKTLSKLGALTVLSVYAPLYLNC